MVVDDFEMGITHVIRGDDHVNNTPRQINILKALGSKIPSYAHLSMILGDDGQKLSKRHGAVSVMQYDDEGYLPEAVLNYLARPRLVARRRRDFLNAAVLRMVRSRPHHAVGSAVQHGKAELAERALPQAGPITRASPRWCVPRIEARGTTVTESPSLEAIVALYKDRATNLNELAEAAQAFYGELTPDARATRAASDPRSRTGATGVSPRASPRWPGKRRRSMR